MYHPTLVIDEPPVQVLPTLASKIGLNQAIVFQQLHYWLGNKNSGVYIEGVKWVYNSYEEWKEQFPFWSTRTIQRIFLDLEASGLVVSCQQSKDKYDHKKYYRIDYDKLALLIVPTCRDGLRQSGTFDNDKMAQSMLTETTTETTTESTSAQEQALKSQEQEYEEHYQEVKRKRMEGIARAIQVGGENHAKSNIFIDLHSLPERVKPLAERFAEVSGFTGHLSKSDIAEWVDVFDELLDRGATPLHVEKAIRSMRADGLTISSPRSIKNVTISKVGEDKSNFSTKPSEVY